jgi:hypothetical protein
VVNKFLVVFEDAENLANGHIRPRQNLKPTFMTQRVKSPVWAIVFLLICLILRFCDPWLFGEENVKKNFPHYQRFRPSLYKRVESQITGHQWQKRARAPDSLGIESHFLR